MGGWETNMRNDTVYKHNYLHTWWSVFLHFLLLLDGISYFHNNMRMKSNTKVLSYQKRGRSFLIQLRICSCFFFEGICQCWSWAKKTENLGLLEQRMVAAGQRKQPSGGHIRLKWKKRKPEIQGASTLKLVSPYGYYGYFNSVPKCVWWEW